MKTGSYWIIAIFAWITASFCVWACTPNSKDELEPDVIVTVESPVTLTPQLDPVIVAPAKTDDLLEPWKKTLVGKNPVYRWVDKSNGWKATCYFAPRTGIECYQQYIQKEKASKSNQVSDLDAERRRENARRRAERARERLKHLRAEAARNR